MIQNYINILLKFSSIINHQTMRNMSSILKPPETVKNMTILDKQAFKKSITVPYMNIGNVKISNVLPAFKKYLLKINHFNPIVKEVEGNQVLLNPTKISEWDGFSEADRNTFESNNLTKNDLKFKSIEVAYDNYTLEEVLRAVLPSDIEGMSSFTKVGHIVHVNLREHLFPFKRLIGQVLNDKVTVCRTVVNKTNNIDNTYRNFQMEVLSGDEDFIVKLKENNCNFEFDFSKVYWNSRLCTEHERIVKMVDLQDVVFDVFAGVGPFSVPIAKKGVTVYANDLNPESFKYLQHNAKINKATETLQMFNLDGGEFIKTVLKENLLKYSDRKVHIIMNLPALAVEFLHCFRELYKSEEFVPFQNCPIIYLYCFAKGEDFIAITKNLVCEHMGDDVEVVDMFRVRTVSSLKEMMRVKIKLNRNILVGSSKRCSEDDAEGNAKRYCNGKEQVKEEQQCL